MGLSALTTRKPVSRSLAKKNKAIIEHIITAASPDQVYLIGSMLRGEIHANSDLDLVVVLNAPFSRQELLLRVLPTRPHFDVPVDLHIVSQEDFDRLKDQGGICFEAAHHGRLIFSREKL
jgi:predicted nucleotidyltransferase